MENRTRALIFRTTAIVLSFSFSYLGINGWWRQWSHCTTVAATVQTVAQFVYGLLGVVVGVVLLRKRTLPKILEWVWPFMMALAAGMAPVVWGGAGIVPGLTSGVAGLLLGVGIIWLARKGTAS